MRIKRITPILIFALLTACKSGDNQDAPIEQPSNVASQYCLNTSLIDSHLNVNDLGNGAFQIQIEDYDGGLRSGSATGTLVENRLSYSGSMTIEMGTAQIQGVLDFSADYQTVTGSLEVLDPGQTVILASTITGQAGACEYNYSAQDVSSLSQTPLLDSHHVELNKIFKVSRYRSAAGHNFIDYSGESCVNLKHYFLTYTDPSVTSSTVLPSSLDYFAPASGEIVTITQARPHVDPDDLEIDIRLDADPNVIVRIFHTTLDNSLDVGSHVDSGDRIGEAPAGHLNGGDLAVYVITSEGYRHISAFEIMTNSLLADYEARGVSAQWSDDLYYGINDPYVSGITCDNGDWGNLNHPNSNYLDDFFILN